MQFDSTSGIEGDRKQAETGRFLLFLSAFSLVFNAWDGTFAWQMRARRRAI
jgi:hypothetical protein